MTWSSTVGRPSVLTPPSGVGLATRVTGGGVYGPLRHGSRMDGHWCVRDDGHSPTGMPSMPGLPWCAFTLCRALCRCSRDTISSLTHSSLTGHSVRSVAMEAAGPGVAAVGVSPLLSAAQARLPGCVCGLAPMHNPASCPLPCTPFGDRAGLHQTSRPATTPLADCCPAVGGLPTASVRFQRVALLGLTHGRSPAVRGIACRASRPD
jgi:hypothetical protein